VSPAQPMFTQHVSSHKAHLEYGVHSAKPTPTSKAGSAASRPTGVDADGDAFTVQLHHNMDLT
jgi:hypothetical protein